MEYKETDGKEGRGDGWEGSGQADRWITSDVCPQLAVFMRCQVPGKEEVCVYDLLSGF